MPPKRCAAAVAMQHAAISINNKRLFMFQCFCLLLRRRKKHQLLTTMSSSKSKTSVEYGGMAKLPLANFNPSAP